MVADLYAPVGGTIREIAFNEVPLPDPAVDRYRGRDVVSLGLPLDPGQTRIVTWTMVTGPDQTAPTEVWVTPGPRSENESSVAPSHLLAVRVRIVDRPYRIVRRARRAAVLARTVSPCPRPG